MVHGGMWLVGQKRRQPKECRRQVAAAHGPCKIPLRQDEVGLRARGLGSPHISVHTRCPRSLFPCAHMNNIAIKLPTNRFKKTAEGKVICLPGWGRRQRLLQQCMMLEPKRTTRMYATAIVTQALDAKGVMPLHHREMPRHQGHAGHRTGAGTRAACAYFCHQRQG